MQLSSLVALKEWVSRTDIQKFDILLCIGNKVDLLPGHPAHTEYKRRSLKHAEYSANPHLDSSEYGISETEGSSLLGDEAPSWEFKQSYVEWCLEHNIEYVEACASNVDFDKCKLFFFFCFVSLYPEGTYSWHTSSILFIAN